MSNATRTCNVNDCDRAHYARGVCQLHYRRAKDQGKLGRFPKRPVATIEERLWSRLVATANGCLEWHGGNVRGYGRIHVDGKSVITHRLAWELVNGPIPDGMLVCHTCDNPPCCNPDHLWLGTTTENFADMDAKGRRVNHESLKTHCVHGHPFDDANTRMGRRGTRVCAACRRQRDMATRARTRDARSLAYRSEQTAEAS